MKEIRNAKRSYDFLKFNSRNVTAEAPKQSNCFKGLCFLKTFVGISNQIGKSARKSASMAQFTIF